MPKAYNYPLTKAKLATF